MDQRRRFTSVLLMAVVIIGFISLKKGQNREYLNFADSLEMTATVVDGEELTLADMAFYIAYVEGLVEKDAIVYDPSNTGKYWNIFTNSSFIRTSAKKTALDMAVHDEIFYQMSRAKGIELNSEEERYLANSCYDFWSDLDDGQKEALGVGRDVLDASMRKVALAEKYQYLYAAMQEADFEAYSFDGDAYLELLNEHDYEITEKVWTRVHFGSITVDH